MVVIRNADMERGLPSVRTVKTVHGCFGSDGEVSQKSYFGILVE